MRGRGGRSLQSDITHSAPNPLRLTLLELGGAVNWSRAAIPLGRAGPRVFTVSRAWALGMRWAPGAAWATWAALAAWAAAARASLLPLEAEQLRASVGGYAVMNCHLDFPFGNEIPYHLQWDKDVSHHLSPISNDQVVYLFGLLGGWLFQV